LISLTVTPGTTAPVPSSTVPSTREVVPWAKTIPQAHRNVSIKTPFLRISGKDIRKGRLGKGVMMTVTSAALPVEIL